MYKIYHEESDKYYEGNIGDIIKIIKNINDINNQTYKNKGTFYKYINNEKIKINEKMLNVHYICHRINSIEELNKIDYQFGIELDIRDKDTLEIIHDPFVKGALFENYIKKYNHGTMIVNVKSERIEQSCINILNKYKINYFFLDSSFPMIYSLNKNPQTHPHPQPQFACRFSEYEPIEHFIKCKEMYDYIWVDCFTKFPLNKENYDIFKSSYKKICIVSPELQKHDKIEEYRKYIIENNIIPDMICCKEYNIIKWI
jgi:hypothetical protein